MLRRSVIVLLFTLLCSIQSFAEGLHLRGHVLQGVSSKDILLFSSNGYLYRFKTNLIPQGTRDRVIKSEHNENFEIPSNAIDWAWKVPADSTKDVAKELEKYTKFELGDWNAEITGSENKIGFKLKRDF